MGPSPGQDLKVLSEGLTDDDPAVREDCAQQLASVRHPDAAPYLRHALDDDAEEVRMWGAYGLGMLARDEDRDELTRAAGKDESPLVRIWATFGLARLGDAQAVEQLVTFLDLPDLDLRSNAADALLSLEDVSQVRPLLERRFASGDDRKRVWSAAVLHRFGHKGALEVWRNALTNPETRVDAAMAAPHLRSIEAARVLVRLVSELKRGELESPALVANEITLGELLTRPLLDLDLEALFRAARKDPALRADILLLVLRSPAADPEVLALLFDFAAELEPNELGHDVAELLSEQAAQDRASLLARMVEFAPDAVVPVLDAMPEDQRLGVIDDLADAASAPSERNEHLAALLDCLRQSPYAEQFADLPDAPWGEEPETDLGVETVEGPEDFIDDEDDTAAIIERIVEGEEVSAEDRAKAEQVLEELGMTAEEFVATLNEPIEDDYEPEPPEPEQVALRALAIAAMLERARIERAMAAKKLGSSEAAQVAARLSDWAQAEGVEGVLSSLELDLLHAAPGDWQDEDVELASMSAEALASLLWALGAVSAIAPDQPASRDELLAKVPLLKPSESFIARAQVKPPDEVSAQRELYETLLWRCEKESAARMLLEGEDIELDIEIDALLPDLEKDGFDAKAAKTKGGDRGVTAEALRFLGMQAARRFAEEKLLAPVNGDFGFRGQALSALDDEALTEVTALAHERQRALEWLVSGGEWDELLVEDGIVDEDEQELG